MASRAGNSKPETYLPMMYMPDAVLALINVAEAGACHSAATALIRGSITTALYLREKTGPGQMVETSVLKAITTYDHVSWIEGQMIA